MHRVRVAAALRFSLAVVACAACVNSTPSSEKASAAAPAPSASSRTSARPPRASAPPPTPSATAAPSASSGTTRSDAGSRVACTFELEAAADTLAKVPSGVIAHALIPSLDPAHMRAKVVRGDGGASVIVDCRGGASPAIWEEAEATRVPTPAGTVRVLGRKPLPDQREAVWLGTARELGACVSEDGYGFLAIVALDGPRLSVLGVSPWHPGCGPVRQLRAEKLGDVTVYVEPDKEGARAGFDGWENVWTLRDGDLHLAGRYDTMQVGAAESGATVDDAGLYPPSFNATAHFVGAEIVVSGQSTWLKPAVGDGGDGSPWTFAKKGPYLHRYELREGNVVEKKGKRPVL